MSTNISKAKREQLLADIKKIREFVDESAPSEQREEFMVALAEIEKRLNALKYGLIFEEHLEKTDEELMTNAPVLTAADELYIDRGGRPNFLIEGDNLAVLRLLEKTHGGKIDFIYIDPPYNTGNDDFIYDDVYVDGNDSFRHSKWLSFMDKRLRCARGLLTERGVIFISVDDNEQAQAKLLCDMVFGPGNFIADLIWANQEGGGSSDSKFFKIKHEHILCYAKNIERCAPFGNVPIEDEARYKLSDEYEAERGKYQLVKLASASIQYSAGMDYEITCPDGSVVRPADNTDKDRAIWRWSRSKLAWGIDNGFVVFKKDKHKVWQVYTKQYVNCDKDGNIVRRTKKPSGIIQNFSSTQGSNQLFSLFGEKKFGYPKPLDLIEWLIARYDCKDATVLDFFAGSGTTGHAVLRQNAADGGNRRFILCTNNENNICRQVTYERLKRAITAEAYSAGLAYYRVKYVPIGERFYYEYAPDLLEHIRGLVELENGCRMADGQAAIVTTDDELDAFCADPAVFERIKTVYLGSDVLPGEEQLLRLNERKIEVRIVPDYYYKELEG